MLRIPPIKHFTVFGVTAKPVEFAAESAPNRVALSHSFGDQQKLFIQTRADNIIETQGTVLLKLGHIYDSSGQFLSAQDLVSQSLISADGIVHESILGDGIVIYFDLQNARITIYRALHSVPEIYYRASNDEFFGSDNLGCLAKLLPEAQLDEEVVPLHFMYRLVCGEKTYLQGVRRILSGSLLRWRVGQLTTETVKNMRSFRSEVRFNELHEESLTFINDDFRKVINDYLVMISQLGMGFGTLLSGGVDSSLIQWLIKDCRPDEPAYQSFSYDVKTPAFEPEVDYAKSSVDTLGTQHTFIPITPESYVDLLVDTIDLLGQPSLAEQEPCFLGLARYLEEQKPETRYLFIGFGADALFGGSLAPIWWTLERFQSLPAAKLWLAPIELLMRRIDTYQAFLLRRVMALLPQINDAYSPEYPGNDYELYTDFDLVKRCFGQEAIKEVFRSWQETEVDYLSSPSLIERSQLVSYLNTERIGASLGYQTFLAHNIRLIHPYHDERLVRAAFAFHPRIRFYYQGTIKPILKKLVARKSPSGNPVKKPKLGSGFYPDLQLWMKKGVLRDMLYSIERPGYISQADFDRKLESPDWFTWNMLTLDLFKRRVCRNS
jgi:hypothetical protein